MSIKNNFSILNKIKLKDLFKKNADEMINIPGIKRVKKDYIKKINDCQGELNRYWVHLIISHILFKRGLLSEVESNGIDIVTKTGLKIELTRIADEEEIIKLILEKNIEKYIKQYLRFDIILNNLESQKISKQFRKDLKNTFSKNYFPQEYKNNEYDLMINKCRRGGNIAFPIDINKGGMINMSSRKGYVLNIHYTNNPFNINKFILNKSTKKACSESQMLIIDFSGSIVIKNHKDFINYINLNFDKKITPENLIAIIFIKFSELQAGITLSIKYFVRENNKIKENVLAVCKAIADSINNRPSIDLQG